MNNIKNIKNICKRIAEKLAINPIAFEKWAKTNGFDIYDLSTIGGQVTYNRINTLSLIMSILDDKKYKIVKT